MKKRVVILGAARIGKTTYVKRITTGEFTEKYIPTLGAEVTEKDGYEIWDTAGEYKYRGLSEGYYIGSDEAIAMFDITNILSFEKLKNLIYKYSRLCPNCNISLIGNKKDLENKRKVTKKMVDQLMLSNKNIVTYTEITCKNEIISDRIFT